jgi:hypothetical protein
VQDGPHNGQALPLATGEILALLAHPCRVAAGQRQDRLMDVRFLGRIDNLRLAGAGTPQRDVVADGPAKSTDSGSTKLMF